MAERNCTCAHCGAGFVALDKRKIYCSQTCKSAAFKARNPDRIESYRAKELAKTRAERALFTPVVLNECATCKRLFYWRKKKARCSRECEQDNARRYAERYYKETHQSSAVREFRCCDVCGKEFVSNTDAQHTCSDKCRRKRQGKGDNRSRARRFGVEYEPVNPLKVFERDGWKCQICGKRTPPTRRGSRYSNAPELDHRIPISKGGPHKYSNVQCSCRQCNGAKSNASSVGQFPLLA